MDIFIFAVAVLILSYIFNKIISSVSRSFKNTNGIDKVFWFIVVLITFSFLFGDDNGDYELLKGKQ